MTDTATETQTTTDAKVKVEAPKITDPSQIDYSQFGAIGDALKTLIPPLFTKADEHNDLVARLAIKEGDLSEEVLESTRLRNKSGNEKVSKINETIEKAMARVAELKEQAYELTKSDIEQPLTAEERPAVQAQVKDLRSGFKETVKSMVNLAGQLGVKEEQLMAVLPSITENGRSTGGTGGKGHSGPRIRATDVYVDGVRAEIKKPNSDEMTSSLSAAATAITKTLKSKISASELQVAYFAAAGSEDTDKIADDVTFNWVYESGDHKRSFEIRVVK